MNVDMLQRLKNNFVLIKMDSRTQNSHHKILPCHIETYKLLKSICCQQVEPISNRYKHPMIEKRNCKKKIFQSIFRPSFCRWNTHFETFTRKSIVLRKMITFSSNTRVLSRFSIIRPNARLKSTWYSQIPLKNNINVVLINM